MIALTKCFALVEPYLVVLDSLGNLHGDRQQLVEATDEWVSYGVKDKFMA